MGASWATAATCRRQWSACCLAFVAKLLGLLEGARLGRFSWPLEIEDLAVEAVWPVQPIQPELDAQQAFLSNMVTEAPWFLTCPLQVGIGPLRTVCHMDSQVVVDWTSGLDVVAEVGLQPLAFALQDRLATLQLADRICPWTPVAPLLRHVPREDNARADQLANDCLDSRAGLMWWTSSLPSVRARASAVSLHCDGASRGNGGASSCGALLSVCVDTEWMLVCYGSRLLGEGTNTFAELCSLIFAVDILECFLSGHVLLD